MEEKRETRRIQSVRGTRDILPPETAKWLWLEERFREVLSRFGYSEVRTPLFEHTELFHKGTGETTEIVQKQMYTFKDRSGRSLTLRPEGTPSVARAVIEHGLLRGSKAIKLYYFGPMFRYDRPQAGRYRQFDQLGAELVGVAGVEGDAESIHLHVALLRELGLEQFTVKINSVGCAKCRPAYSRQVRESLKGRSGGLCDDCRDRIERNPLRVLDCKVDACRKLAQSVPSILGSLCSECREHFDGLQRLLTAIGIEFQVDPGLVRGLDYYTRAAFEIHHSLLGAQSALGGGGRYDDLIAIYGGQPTPAVGFAAGLDRILLAVEEEHLPVPSGAGIDVYVVSVSDSVRQESFSVAAQLRRSFKVEQDLGRRSLQAQMKSASSLGARLAAIMGEDELKAGTVTLRDMGTGEQETVPRDEMVARIESKLGQADER